MKGRRSEWRGNPGSRRSRRSRSPLIGRKQRNLSQKRSYRSSGRRSASKERPPLRRPDHGKDPVQEHTLLPPQQAHNRHGSLPPRDDGFRFQQNPVLPDQPATNPTWRLPQAVNHREFYSQVKVSDALPSSSLGNIDGHFRQQKPAYGQEGSPRLLYSEQPMGSTLLDSERSRNSGDVIGTGIRENEFRPLNDRHRVQHGGNIGMGIQDIEMHSYNGLHRDQYDDANKKQVYSKDMSFPKMPSAQQRIFFSAPSSSILKEEFKELRHDGNPDGLAPGIRRYPNDPLEHYTYRDISQPDPLMRNLPDPLRRGVPDSLRRDLPDPLRRDLPNPLRRELPDPLKRDLPDSLRRDLPDPFRRDLPDTLRRDAPDPLRRDLPDPMRRDRPDPLRGDPASLLRRDLLNPLSRDLPNPLRGDPPNPLRGDPPNLLRRDLPNPMRRDLPNPMRRDLPNPLTRDLPDDSRAYDYDDLHPRGLDDYQHRVQEELYTRPPSRRNFTSSAIVDYNEGWMEKADSTNRTSVERKFSGHRDSIYRDFTHDFRDVGAQQELRLQELRTNSDNWRGGLRTKLSRDYETMPFEEEFTSENEYFPADYREEHRHKRPLLSDHDLDHHKLVVSTHNRLDELRDYDIERIDQRHYTIFGDVDESDSDVFGEHRHSYAPYESEEMWLAEGRAGPPPSNSMFSEKPRYRKFSRNISASDAFMTRGASSRHAKNDHNGNLKRRLKRGRSEFHDTSFSERRQDLLRSYKHGKKEMHERLGVQGGGTHESGSHFRKDDPPEDSEEFRQQVHKAFLRYSKLLNESPHGHRIYQNPGNPSSLQCCVCGSSSKEFADIKNLVTHTYHSLKVGLKTEHLGFHKALCVLFGWNWRVPPDASMSYQSMPVTEAEAMREDLILWPPLVIIHDSSIPGNVNNGATDVTVEEMKKILRDMGFGTGMTGACLGKPSNKGIFAVKFMPTFSGLQEAQRLHNHFASKKCGKQEFRSNGKSNQDGNIQFEDSDATLYGYMALAEDLDKLSEDTKKRCLVKSRKDIQAIADAPLNTAD